MFIYLIAVSSFSKQDKSRLAERVNNITVHTCTRWNVTCKIILSTDDYPNEMVLVSFLVCSYLYTV